jgi:tetratricopeptide (TPR) repeat protein
MRKERRPRLAAATALAKGLIFLWALALAQAAFAQAPIQGEAPVPALAQAPRPAAAAMEAAYQSASQLFWRGRQLQIAGKEAEAAKAFASSLQATEKLLASEPSNPDYVNLQCWNLFRLGRHGEVVAAAQKALKAAKDHRIIETLAESLYFLDRDEEALANFTQYFILAPENEERMSSAYYYVGECYMRLKKYEHADIAFSTATTMEKNMYYWWYRLGAVKEILSQYRRAYEAYGKALQISPKFQYALDGRARVKAKAGL